MSALQCCVSFCSPAVGLSCMFAYVCAPSLLRRPPSRRHPGASQSLSAARVLCCSPRSVRLIRGRDVSPRCSLH